MPVPLPISNIVVASREVLIGAALCLIEYQPKADAPLVDKIFYYEPEAHAPLV